MSRFLQAHVGSSRRLAVVLVVVTAFAGGGLLLALAFTREQARPAMVVAQGMDPTLDGMVWCDVVCPPADSPEVCPVEVFSEGQAPALEEVDGWWLVSDVEKGQRWVYDGRFVTGASPVRRVRGPETFGLTPTPGACPDGEDIIAFGWNQLVDDHSELSKVTARVMWNNCPCIPGCYPPCPTKTATPAPTSTLTPTAGPSPTATPTPTVCCQCIRPGSAPCVWCGTPLACPTDTVTPTPPPCATCRPATATQSAGLGTPSATPYHTVAIPTAGTAEATRCAADLARGYIDWRRWYPLYVGQGAGQRAVNWFSQPGECLNEAWAGTSIWDYPAIPRGMPAQYEGQCVDYYWFWGCKDPTCQFDVTNPGLYVEMLATSSDGRYADRWGFGSPTNWFEVYFNPERLNCACNSNALRDYFLENPNELNNPDNRMPLRFEMSSRPGESRNNPPVCTVRFNHAVTADGSLSLTVCNLVPGSAHLEFVRTTLLGYMEDDSGAPCNMLRALNEYFTSDCSSIDAECNDALLGWCRDTRCARQGRAVRYSPFAGTATPATTPAPPCSDGQGDCTWCSRIHEVWDGTRMDAPYVGALTLLTYNGHNCASDDCVRYYVEDFVPGPGEENYVQLVPCAPTPGFWPHPCPTKCNGCPDCGVPPLQTGTPSPEVCCASAATRTPTPGETLVPCYRCPAVVTAGVPTTVRGCCGTVVPRPSNTPTLLPSHSATWIATCGTPTPTPTPSPTGTRPTPKPTFTPAQTQGPSPTLTATPTWIAPCCSMTRSASFRYFDVVTGTPPPLPTQACQAHDSVIDNGDEPFDVSAFCGPGTDRYGAVVEIDACCGSEPCDIECDGMLGVSPVTLTGYNADHEIVYPRTDLCVTSIDGHLRIDLGCQFDSDNLPVRWRVEMGATTGLRPWQMTVHYGCCYGGNCGPTATP
jgi:hypothetical protein